MKGNQSVVTYNKIQGMIIMRIIAPRAESLNIITFLPSKKMHYINTIILTASWADSLEMIYLDPVRKIEGHETNSS